MLLFIIIIILLIFILFFKPFQLLFWLLAIFNIRKNKNLDYQASEELKVILSEYINENIISNFHVTLLPSIGKEKNTSVVHSMLIYINEPISKSEFLIIGKEIICRLYKSKFEFQGITISSCQDNEIRKHSTISGTELEIIIPGIQSLDIDRFENVINYWEA